MAEFKHRHLATISGRYQALPSGKDYVFDRGRATKVYDKQDAEYFRNHPDFEEMTAGKKISEKVINTKRKIDKKKEPTFEERLIDLKEVDDEIAGAIMRRYSDWDDFLKNVTKLDLISISGIGNIRGKRIMAQVEAARV